MTIKEIAALAGVSSAAVSRYLNGGSLSQAKHHRISEVIAQTNYSPSSYARAMRTKKSCQIGVILPNIESESGPRVVSGISSVLHLAGYHFLLADTEDIPQKELDYLRIFKNSQLDGLILVASAINDTHLELLKSIAIPVVIIGRQVEGYPCIYHDDRKAAADMMTLLLNSDCKAPAYIGVAKSNTAAERARREGIIQALQNHGCAPVCCQFQEAAFTAASSETAARQLLAAHPETDGIFCATDLIAIGALQAIHSAGLRIPEDIRLCGIGNHPISGLIQPGLTTVQYHYKTSGQKAAQLLLDMIAQPGCPVAGHLLDYELIRRGTL